MEVKILSSEAIKPSQTSTNDLKPHKLCLFDQLTPMTYIIGVLFYPVSKHNSMNNVAETLIHLKKCLSQTLDLYYPYSGRNRPDNLYVDSFDSGVLFLDAEVNCRMSDYLSVKDVDFLNKLVPFAPFRRETSNPREIPLLAIQFSVFKCGGFSIGASLCHKNGDGTSSCFLINSWASLCRGFPERVIEPSLPDSALVFPPMENGLPEKYSSLMDRLWFTEGSFVTRRFIFSDLAVEALRSKGTSERVSKPSRNDAVSCFIWKHATEASWSVSGKKTMSFAGPAVNVRPRMRTPSAANAVGNLFWWGMAVIHPDEAEIDLSEMVVQMKEAMVGFDRDFLKEVKEGREGSSEIINQLELMIAIEPEEPFIIGFTNWRGFFNEVDFGWGKPYWVGAMGKVGPAFRNLVVLVESQWGQGIEAFIALDQKEMAVLETDPKFLAFASLEKGSSSL